MKAHTCFTIEQHEDMTFPFSIYKNPINKNKRLLPHYHESFEIIYISKGSMHLKIGNDTFIATKGEIYFSNLYQLHSVEPFDNIEGEFYAFVFDKKIITQVNTSIHYQQYIIPFLQGEHRFPVSIDPSYPDYERLTKSITEILQEYMEKKIGYEICISSEIEKLLILLTRYNKYINHEYLEISQINKEIIDKMWLYIKEKYHQKITLDGISAALYINKYHFCRVIKKLTGSSFTQLLALYRIQQAINLLSTTDLPINSIVEECGFTNQSYFNRMYIKYVGEKPSQTRKRIIYNKSMTT
ncbi:AraC family transcriptional regulator [Vallitalea okinawensis]|uniref:AraC family transcriptional regulator n=1 Tax=Vallitalea okinawensis TaxID=2078660 RepID=UPI000CFAC15C|nr:AraC family transcriptional regulator [Vallitalea okinawensis]